jgi:hypothetical protein
MVGNNTTIYSTEKDTVLHFSFNGSCPLRPMIYTYGHAKVTVLNAYGTQQLFRNISSIMTVRFKDPGKQTIMLIWEGKRVYSDPFVVTVEYRP